MSLSSNAYGAFRSNKSVGWAKARLTHAKPSLVLRFRGSNHIAASLNLVLRSALARVSKDGHKRDRASGHPSRRRFAPPQDEVCVCLSSIRLIRLVSWNRSTSVRAISDTQDAI